MVSKHTNSFADAHFGNDYHYIEHTFPPHLSLVCLSGRISFAATLQMQSRVGWICVLRTLPRQLGSVKPRTQSAGEAPGTWFPLAAAGWGRGSGVDARCWC